MPGVIGYEVIRVVVQQFYGVLLDVEYLLPNVVFRFNGVVPAVRLYNVFYLTFGFSLGAFSVGYYPGF